MTARTQGQGSGGRHQGAQRRNPLRTLIGALLILGLLLVLLLAGAALIVQSRLDEGALRARIEREVLRQTGRQLTLGGLHVQLLPVPTVSARQISFANWPQGSRPLMLTAAAVQAHLALLPLLEHVVRLEGLTLDHPDILLERAADGHANWLLQKPSQPGRGGPAGGGGRWRVEIGSVRLRDGSLAWTDAQHGWSGAVQALRADGSGLAGDGPAVTFAGRRGDGGFDAVLHTGALSGLSDDARPQVAWPVHLDARAQDHGRQTARLVVDGTLADPARARGYALDFELQATRLEGLNSLFPNARLPAIAALSVRTSVTDGASAEAARGDPQLGALSLQAGPFDAHQVLRRAWTDGLAVASLSLQAKAADAPLAVALDGARRGRALTLRGTAGTLAAWQQRSRRTGWGPVPLALDLAAGDAHAHVAGNAGSATTDLRVEARVPALQPLLGAGPSLTDLMVSARVQTRQDMAFTVSDLRLESRQLGLTGMATLVATGRPSLSAAIDATHVDLDALRSGWMARPSSATPRDIATPSRPGPPSAAVPANGHVIPFAALRLADLAISLHARSVRLGGDAYADVAGQLAVQDGRLTLAPFSATGPAGPIAATLSADAATAHVALSLHPMMIRAEALADLLGQRPVLTGITELVAELQASGATREALVADLAGSAGASMVNGSVANAALGQLLGRSVGLDGDGQTGLRCLALPARLAGGIATIAPLALQTRRLDVQGHGTVALQDGALDLHLLPRLSVGSAGASLPVHVGGTLGMPQAALDPAAPGGRFALTIGPGGPAPDVCGPALQAARFGVPGPQPGAMPGTDRPRKAPKPIDILRGLGLFR